MTRNRQQKSTPRFKNCTNLKLPNVKEDDVDLDKETANVIRIFEDKDLDIPRSDFDTSASEDSTDYEDDTKSIRSRYVTFNMQTVVEL